MPDVDRFAKVIRGKGWRKVYRLARAGAPAEVVVDRIIRAAVNVFSTERTQCIRAIYSKLQQGISPLSGAPLFRASLSETAFDQLSSDLHRIMEEEGYSELARLGERAALRTFNEVDQAGQLAGDQVTRAHFLRNLVWELSERKCMGAVRDVIMQSTGRDAQAELEWENELRDLLLDPSAALCDKLLAEGVSGPIRAPKRLFRPKPTTLETLSQPLRVLGEPA